MICTLTGLRAKVKAIVSCCRWPLRGNALGNKANSRLSHARAHAGPLGVHAVPQDPVQQSTREDAPDPVGCPDWVQLSLVTRSRCERTSKHTKPSLGKDNHEQGETEFVVQVRVRPVELSALVRAASWLQRDVSLGCARAERGAPSGTHVATDAIPSANVSTIPSALSELSAMWYLIQAG